MVLETLLLAGLLTCVAGSRSALPDVAPEVLSELRELAVKGFPEAKGPVTDYVNARFKLEDVEGSESFFEQTLQLFKGEKSFAWNLRWGIYFMQTLELRRDIKEVPVVEWTQMVLESVVMPEGGEMGLECLKFGACAGTGAPQYLLQASHSGDLIPILLERGSDDEFWSAWTSGDFGAFAAGPGLQKLSALERFNFLGQWMARAYVIGGYGSGYSPASFHSIIYESLMAGRAAKPLPLPNAYQDEDSISECEWLAAIYGSRRPQELETYGWQGCDEIQDQSGRYTQESCYKPLYRSKEMWENLAIRWPSAEGAGSKVPFERGHEYTRLKCSSKWVQDFQVPVNALVKGFRQVISDPTFWKQADSKALKHLVEGDSEINVSRMIEAISFEGKWTDDQKQVLTDTLRDLDKKDKGLPPSKNALNKLLRFFTGSSKEPVHGFGFKALKFELVSDANAAKGSTNDTNGINGTNGTTGTNGTENGRRQCAPLRAKTIRSRLHLPEECLTTISALTGLIQKSLEDGATPQRPQPYSARLRQLAQPDAPLDGGYIKILLNRTGEDSIFEQTKQYFASALAHWRVQWNGYTMKINFAGEVGIDAGGLRKEWQQLVLQSLVMPKNQKEGLQCLKFGKCSGAGSPQYLLETLPSGDAIPVLSFEHGHEDRFWSEWMSDDFLAFMGGSWSQIVSTLERFNFLGRWLARAYVISNLGFAPVSFHSVIYESLVAGRAVAPKPAPNEYQDEDIIPECEWLAAIYGSRRPQELETYGWQSCDEIQDPESGRYTQDGCYKPLYRSSEMWEYLYSEWGPLASQGSKADDLVPFERAREYTMLKCKSKWGRDFQAPVNELVAGFRQVISDSTFWKKVDSTSLKRLVEGDSEINVTQLVGVLEFGVFGPEWTEDQKQLLKDTLYELGKKHPGVPPSQNPLNKLLRFSTGLSKEPVGGFKEMGVDIGQVRTDPNITNSKRPCGPLTADKPILTVPEGCLTDSSVLSNILQSVTNIGVGGQHGQKLERLRKAALKYFATNTEESLTLGLNRAGNSSIFEQTRDFFVNGREKGWHTTWNRDAYTNIFFNGEAGLDAGGLKKEWQQLVLQSIVLPDKHQGEGLHCLKFGHCSSSDSQVPQYLLETLPSGDLIPILNFERGAEDRPWSYWGGDFSAFARGARLQTLRSLQRFNFLGRWLARAYVISGLGFSPASFHSIIYESLLAGHVVAPPPIPNAYKDEDTIPECEWLATILRSRRPQELETYGWQSCDEIQDPESGRYLQESCYKPLYRSTEMWEYLYAEWGHVAPQGIKADDLVPFERAREYTVLKCRSKWEQDFQAPVNAMVKGFRQVISDPTFWNVADAEALRQLVEGDSEVNVACMIEAASFEGGWSEDEKKVLIDTLHDLSQKNKGLPPFQNTLNKLLRFFTGSFKEPVEGFNRKKVWFHKVAGERCAPLIGKTCFNKLILRAGCLKSISTLEDMIKESVAVEGFHMA